MQGHYTPLVISQFLTPRVDLSGGGGGGGGEGGEREGEKERGGRRPNLNLPDSVSRRVPRS